jgi:serine/threonine-protein kinase
VFSLGCILYEILSGEVLYLRQGSRALTSNAGEVPPELDALWRAATAREPAERVARARELGEAVQRYLDGDRDVALRRDLARKHLDRAYHAVTDRRVALREAGCALVLEPTAEAATLVGRLMLERPAEMPAEVDRAVADHDAETVRQNMRSSKWASLGFAWLVPAIVAMFARQPVWAVAMLCAPLVVSAISFGLPIGRVRTVAVAAANVILLGTLAHVFSPFFFAPCFAAIVVMTMAGSPQVSSWGGTVGLAATMAGAVLVTWLVEALGVLPTTTIATRGTLVLAAPGFDIPSSITYVVAVLWVVVAVFAVGAMGHARRRSELALRRELELQAWQLRQLFPA